MKTKLQNVLLIDDDDLANRLNEMVLEESACTEKIISVQSGEAALNYLMKGERQSQSKPDLIFLDLNMPGMNGWEFLDMYKTLDKEQQDHMVIVILTTSVNPADQEKAKSIEQVRDFRHKPITLEMIEDILETHFSFS